MENFVLSFAKLCFFCKDYCKFVTYVNRIYFNSFNLYTKGDQ